MKILSISSIQLLPYLGSGQTRLQWTNGLKKMGHEVKILQPVDFELFPKLRRAKKYRQAIGVLWMVRKLLKKNKYDLIEFYGDEYWLLLLWLKKRKRLKTIIIAHVDGIELHDMDKEQLYWNKRKGIERWIYRKTHYYFSQITFSNADKFVCGCQGDLDYVFKTNLFSLEDAKVISPGINDLFHVIPFHAKKQKVIVFIGAWLKRKGVLIIPIVMSEVLREFPDYSFHVYGAWSDKDNILSSFTSDLRSRIIVFDKLPLIEMIKGLSVASIFFFPSYSEGFGLATVEAMSCSCAVVTTPTGIGSDLINDKNAIICDFNDSADMIKAIEELISDEDKRKSIAYQGFLKAKEFIWEKKISDLNSLYIEWGKG